MDEFETEGIDRFFTIYSLIGTALALLPIPIALPALDRAEDAGIAIDTADRALALMAEQPMNPDQRRALQTAIVHWLTSGVLLGAGLAERKMWIDGAVALNFAYAERALKLAFDLQADDED